MNSGRRLEPRAKQTWISTFNIEFYENFLMTLGEKEREMYGLRKPCFCVEVGSSHFVLNQLVLHWHAASCHFCKVLKSIWHHLFNKTFLREQIFEQNCFNTTFWVFDDCEKLQISEDLNSGCHNKEWYGLVPVTANSFHSYILDTRGDHLFDCSCCCL